MIVLVDCARNCERIVFVCVCVCESARATSRTSKSITINIVCVPSNKLQADMYFHFVARSSLPRWWVIGVRGPPIIRCPTNFSWLRNKVQQKHWCGFWCSNQTDEEQKNTNKRREQKMHQQSTCTPTITATTWALGRARKNKTWKTRRKIPIWTGTSIAELNAIKSHS